MPRPRWNRLPRAERDHILDAAAREFGAAGFHDASLNRILDLAGLSKGAAYYLFDDKEDLFLTLIRHRLGEPLARAAREADGEPFWEACAAMARRALAELEADPLAFALARDLYALHAGARSPGVLAIADEVQAWTGALLARGQAEGAVRTDLPLPLLTHLTVAVGEALDRWGLATREGDEAALDALMPGAMDLFVRLLAPPGGLPGEPMGPRQTGA